MLACVGRYKPEKHSQRGADGPPDPFSSSSSEDNDARRGKSKSRGGGAGSDDDVSGSETETESEEEEDWVTPQEWRSWRAPREQRWDNVESHSGGAVLGAGVGGAGGGGGGLQGQRSGAQSGAYGSGGSGTIRRPGAAPTAAAVMAASARHLSKGAKASLHLD